MQKHNQGFTIIELIVVIAIIAILAAIVMVNVTQYINKSKIASAQSNMDQLANAALNWVTDPNGGNGNIWNGPGRDFCNSPDFMKIYNSNEKLDLHMSCTDGSYTSQVGAPCYADRWMTFFRYGDVDWNVWCVDYTGVKIMKPEEQINSSNCTCN
ncbi:MAG: prepilin-type N-terminal cleavage/methylation domain-containing protein [Candidatus Staskawiczbacteria bacterium]